MVDMDTSRTEFDPELDEPRWNVTVYSHTREYNYTNISADHKDALAELMDGRDFEWEDEETGQEDYIWADPIERVLVTKGKTLRDQQEEAEMIRQIRTVRWM